MSIKTKSLIAVIALAPWAIPQSQAAVTSTQLLVNFSGIVSGSNYTFASGESVNNGTFTVVGSPTISGGQADLTGGTTGFRYTRSDTTLGSQSWIAEAVVDFDAFSSQATFINVQGDVDFRVHFTPSTLQFIYWDGAARSNTPALPTLNTFNHYALAWDSTTTALSGYRNGTLLGTLNFNQYIVSNQVVSFGFSHNANGRGIDGQMDAIAFSTFTGTFNPNTAFLLIPEPSALAMFGGLFLVGLGYRRRA
jgi:hypothetical protein